MLKDQVDDFFDLGKDLVSFFVGIDFLEQDSAFVFDTKQIEPLFKALGSLIEGYKAVNKATSGIRVILNVLEPLAKWGIVRLRHIVFDVVGLWGL